MQEKNYSFILPEGLIETIQSTLKGKGQFKYTKRGKLTQDSINLLYKYLYVPNYLLESKIDKRDSYKKNGVAINFTLLKDTLSLSSEETKAILNYFIKEGIIELVNQYVYWGFGSKENKSRTYRFTEEWDNKKVYNHECPNDSTFIKKRLIEKNCSKKQKTSKSLTSIANDDIVNYQMKMFEESVGVHQTVHDYFSSMKEEVRFDVNHFYLHSILKKENKFKIARPVKDSRLYSPLTSIKRELRQYLTLDGKQLIGLDVVGCQLLLSAIAVENYFKSNYKGVELPDDMIEYKQISEAGLLYEKLAEQEGKTSMLQKDRSKYKQRLYKLFFFSKNSKRPNKLQQAFKALFPSVFDMIVEIKTNHNYNEWAKIMQEVESVLMLDSVSKKLIERGIKFLNLHDGIYFSTLEDLKVGEEILINTFKENGGVNVKTKIEQYEEPTEFKEEETDSNVTKFESKTNIKLEKHYFKLGDTYFNVKKLTRKTDAKGSKSKKLSMKQFIKLYEQKKAVEQGIDEQTIEYKETKITNMIEYSSMVFKSRWIYQQFIEIEKLTGIQLEPSKIDIYNEYDFNDEWAFRFGGEYSSSIRNKHTNMFVSYGGYKQYPIEEFVPDIISLIKEEQLLIQSVAAK
ncbi:hypothetical protein SIO70_11790 [Chitinophaga sancti]|uniref:hypothetical protein n=1 Tax=Chitinophaga sancti TaxID=1004 RepID=UPI002A75182D|nr:hypothetical protein [Chitinophaga sancti]WPQ65530.1 hypothetical protein SIO70_11790 [Chitinophaga sancti]